MKKFKTKPETIKFGLKICRKLHRLKFPSCFSDKKILWKIERLRRKLLSSTENFIELGECGEDGDG